jgi:hypothetical protein
MSKIGTLRDLLFDLLQEHERDGTIPTNARFLYYELVQRRRASDRFFLFYLFQSQFPRSAWFRLPENP